MKRSNKLLDALKICRLALICAVAMGSMAARAQQLDMQHQHHATAGAAAPDARQLVQFPPEVEALTLSTMRVHLQGVADIQQALSESRLDDAARIATHKLAFASMHDEQGQQEARYMPAGMRQLGMQLHQQAGAFALAAQDAAATGDARPATVLFGRVLQTCVACHDAYRLH